MDDGRLTGTGTGTGLLGAGRTERRSLGDAERENQTITSLRNGNAFGDWLLSSGISWDTVATLTFRNNCHQQVERLGARIVNHLGRVTGHRVAAFICSERGSVTGRYHLHGLLACGNDGRAALREFWRMAFGFVDIKPFEREGGYAHYVTKYVGKEAGEYGEYGIFGTGYGWESIQERPQKQKHQAEIEGAALLQREIIEYGQKEAGKRLRLRRENGGSESDEEWIDAVPMSGYTRYLSELNRLGDR